MCAKTAGRDKNTNKQKILTRPADVREYSSTVIARGACLKNFFASLEAMQALTRHKEEKRLLVA